MLLIEYPAGTAADQFNPDTVPLATIQQRLSVAPTTAGEIRQEALTLLKDGHDAYAATDTAYERTHQHDVGGRYPYRVPPCATSPSTAPTTPTTKNQGSMIRRYINRSTGETATPTTGAYPRSSTGQTLPDAIPADEGINKERPSGVKQSDPNLKLRPPF